MARGQAQDVGSSRAACPGQPSASAIGLGMAMTSGVIMNGVPLLAIAGSPWSASRWSRIAPQALDAGDQMTGAGPLPSVVPAVGQRLRRAARGLATAG